MRDAVATAAGGPTYQGGVFDALLPALPLLVDLLLHLLFFGHAFCDLAKFFLFTYSTSESRNCIIHSRIVKPSS